MKLDDTWLTTKLEEFNFEDPSVDPNEFATDLCKFMMENKALGLAANQVGFPIRVCAINCEPKLVMYNPRIVYYNDEYNVATEGCLSSEALLIKIRRPSSVRVRYFDPSGEMMARTFSGDIARVIQHEIDHLDGIDFTQRATSIHLKEAKRKMKIHKRKLKKMRLL